MKRSTTWFVASLGALWLLDCSRAEDDVEVASRVPLRTLESPETSPERRLSHAARRAHALADRATTGPEKERALTELAHLLGDFPQARSPSALWAKQDAAARAGRLALSRGHLEQAQALLSQGLSLDAEDSVLRAQLYLVLADVLDAQGETRDSRSALLEALRINQVLLDKELQNP